MAEPPHDAAPMFFGCISSFVLKTHVFVELDVVFFSGVFQAPTNRIFTDRPIHRSPDCAIDGRGRILQACR